MKTLRSIRWLCAVSLRAVAWCSVASCAAALLGCGQEPPPAPVSVAPYQPLVDGARWAYQHSDWTEQVTLTASTLDDEPAFLMTDSPNPSDGVRSDATMVAVNGRVLRKTKQEYLIDANGTATLQASLDYGVGFTRFDESWGEQAVGFKETPEYQRIETPAGGTARAPQARRHTFEILSLSETVQTSVGSFDCIKIRRTKDWEAEAEGLDASDAEPKIFWFARGVGKVRELNPDTGRGELLSDYFIPE